MSVESATTLSVSFSFTPNTVASGTETMGDVDIGGGVSPYTLWFNDTAPGCSPSSNPMSEPDASFNFTCNPSNPGSYNIHLDVLDADNNHGSAVADLNVNQGSNGGNGNGGSKGSNSSGNFSLPAGLLTMALIFGAVVLVSIVILAAGVILTAVLVSRRLKELAGVMAKANSPPGPNKPSK